MSEGCPSNFALDAFRLGLDDGPAAHVEACARCTAWLGEQERLEASISGFWVPAATKPRWNARWLLRFLLGLGLPIAAGVAALLLLVPAHGPPGEIAKGAGVKVVRSRAGALSWLSTGDTVLPNDAIRFFVNGADAADRYVLIASVDGSQALAHFYPQDAAACSEPLPPAGEAMHGSIVVDGTPGPERFVIVVSHQPLCWSEVGDAVRAFALEGRLAGSLRADDVHATRLTFTKRLGVAP